jgi:hypothetical protein
MPRTSARSADSLKNPVSRRLRYVKHPDPIRWCTNGPRNRSVSDAARVILKIFAMGIVQRRPTRSILKQYKSVLPIAKFSSGHDNRFRPHVGGRFGQLIGNQGDWICMTKIGIIEPSRVVFFSVDREWQQAPGIADLVHMFPKQISNLRLNAIDVDM